MAKKPTRFTCSNCGASQTQWAGKCSSCQQWNTLEEEAIIADSLLQAKGRSLQTYSIKDVVANQTVDRILSSDEQLQQVLGGGFVRGSVVLLAGQPGIGKSTLLLQIAHDVSRKSRVLYVSGEESAHQVAARAERLSTREHDLKLVSSNSTDDIAETIRSKAYDLVVVDSIQTVSCQAVSSTAGSISQITNSTHMLTQVAKATNTCVLLVGHVTKEGSIAGPKVLEHSVDTVLQLEGDRYGGFKMLRSVKNRFGSTHEVAVYDMGEQGLQPVLNPSEALLAERFITDGSVVLATMEGSRPLLVEIQALVNKTVYGYPKRATSGFDLSRLNLLLAMLERRTKLSLGDKDIYINVVGGIQLQEPAADLAICMAVASAAKGMQLKKNAVVFGELGLSGEVRHVPHIDKRLAEANKLGFDGGIGPMSKKKLPGLFSVTDIKTALNSFLEKE